MNRRKFDLGLAGGALCALCGTVVLGFAGAWITQRGKVDSSLLISASSVEITIRTKDKAKMDAANRLGELDRDLARRVTAVIIDNAARVTDSGVGRSGTVVVEAAEDAPTPAFDGQARRTRDRATNAPRRPIANDLALTPLVAGLRRNKGTVESEKLRVAWIAGGLRFMRDGKSSSVLLESRTTPVHVRFADGTESTEIAELPTIEIKGDSRVTVLLDDGQKPAVLWQSRELDRLKATLTEPTTFRSSPIWQCYLKKGQAYSFEGPNLKLNTLTREHGGVLSAHLDGIEDVVRVGARAVCVPPPDVWGIVVAFIAVVGASLGIAEKITRKTRRADRPPAEPTQKTERTKPAELIQAHADTKPTEDKAGGRT